MSGKAIGLGKAIELQYVALREEIVKRLEIRHQLIAINVTLAGVLLGFGLATPTIALLYPPLALVLAIGWVHNELFIRQLSNYISVNIESSVEGMGWDRYRQTTDRETRFGHWPLNLLSGGGVLLISQLVAICIGVLQFTYSRTDWFLLGISCVSTVLLVLLLWEFRRRREAYLQVEPEAGGDSVGNAR